MAVENLVPMNERTKEEQSKIATMGGKASGEARRAKKNMQELAKIILNMSITNGEVHSVEDMQSIADIKGKNLTVDQMILLKQVEKALKGNLQSATFVRDTSGNKPKEEIGVSGELNNPYSELTVEELRKLAGD